MEVRRFVQSLGFPRRFDGTAPWPLTPREVLEKTFKVRKRAEGYDPDEVDDYLEFVAASMAGFGPEVTAWDVRQHEFEVIRKRDSFDPAKVDDFLEWIAQTLEGSAGEYPYDGYLLEGVAYEYVDYQAVEYPVDYAVDYSMDVHIDAYQVDAYPPGLVASPDGSGVAYADPDPRASAPPPPGFPPRPASPKRDTSPSPTPTPPRTGTGVDANRPPTDPPIPS